MMQICGIDLYYEIKNVFLIINLNQTIVFYDIMKDVVVIFEVVSYDL